MKDTTSPEEAGLIACVPLEGSDASKELRQWVEWVSHAYPMQEFAQTILYVPETGDVKFICDTCMRFRRITLLDKMSVWALAQGDSTVSVEVIRGHLWEGNMVHLGSKVCQTSDPHAATQHIKMCLGLK